MCLCHNNFDYSEIRQRLADVPMSIGKMWTLSMTRKSDEAKKSISKKIDTYYSVIWVPNTTTWHSKFFIFVSLSSFNWKMLIGHFTYFSVDITTIFHLRFRINDLAIELLTYTWKYVDLGIGSNGILTNEQKYFKNELKFTYEKLLVLFTDNGTVVTRIANRTTFSYEQYQVCQNSEYILIKYH